MESLPLVFIAVAASIVIAIAIVAWQVEKRRRARFAAWAAENGWTYEPGDDSGRPSRYARFKPFGLGHSRRAQHVLHRRLDDVDVEVFEYQYTVQTGKHSQTYVFTVAAGTMPLDGHGLVVKTEHLGHKLVDALGGEDIDVEHDEFSRRFWVQCQDRRFAYDILHPPMIDFLLARGARWTWQWGGHKLVLHAPGRIKPERAAAMASDLLTFRKTLPRHRLHEVKHAR